jgi:hypothetical protein
MAPRGHEDVTREREDSGMNRRPWKRLATRRAGRRRGLEVPMAPGSDSPDSVPPFEPPDDDREFVCVVRVGFPPPIGRRPEAA